MFELDIHVAIYESYMLSRRLRWLDTPLTLFRMQFELPEN